jgi:transposase
MVVLGVDAHKRSHTVVAVDEVGRKLAERTFAATADGHLEVVAWAARWPERRFALEDCRHVTRRLEADLLAAGEAVVRVPAHLAAGERRGGREPGKSDPIDALAVARAALREPDLPVARLDGPARDLRLLVDHREDLVAERTRMLSRLRWHLHELFPDLEIAPRALRRQHMLDRVEQRLRGAEGTVARIALELLARCRELFARAAELEREIRRRVRQLAPTLLEPSRRPRSSARSRGRRGSARARRSPGGTARPPSRCGRATTPGTG